MELKGLGLYRGNVIFASSMLLRESVNARIDVNQPKCPFRPPLLLILSLTCPKRKKKETHHERYSPTHTELAIFKSNFCKNNAILAIFLPLFLRILCKL